jgi:hypothetical protein
LRRRGVPTLIVCTDSFLPLAELEAHAIGLEDLNAAVMPHPLGGIAEEEVRSRVEVIWPAVLKWLGSPDIAAVLDEAAQWTAE